jgi:hypothetical protein
MNSHKKSHTFVRITSSGTHMQVPKVVQPPRAMASVWLRSCGVRIMEDGALEVYTRPSTLGADIAALADMQVSQLLDQLDSDALPLGLQMAVRELTPEATQLAKRLGHAAGVHKLKWNFAEDVGMLYALLKDHAVAREAKARAEREQATVAAAAAKGVALKKPSKADAAAALTPAQIVRARADQVLDLRLLFDYMRALHRCITRCCGGNLFLRDSLELALSGQRVALRIVDSLAGLPGRTVLAPDCAGALQLDDGQLHVVTTADGFGRDISRIEAMHIRDLF